MIKSAYCPLCNKVFSILQNRSRITNCPDCNHHLNFQPVRQYDDYEEDQPTMEKQHTMCYTTMDESPECNKTRGDQIREMNDYDLAWILMDFRFDGYATAKGDQPALPRSQDEIRKWLGQKVEINV